ncbi:hypothetical protein [Streptomyces sp. NPDC056683]|uniref:hypothetical protein n=1 Tax=Streptomyces sp. NPDC056683 TaxID=3345910 RepID=UPI0036C3D0D6
MRLRVILAHLDKQMADYETIATYLRLQCNAVQAAITQAEAEREPRAARPPQQVPRRMKLRPGWLLLSLERTPMPSS